MVAAEYHQKVTQCPDMCFGLDPVYLPLALDPVQVQKDTASGSWLILRFWKIRGLVPSRLLHFTLS